VLERETPPLGLILKRDKTRVLWPRTSAELADSALIGLPALTGSMVVLGTAGREDAQQRRDFWQDQRNAARAPHSLPAQTALHLARASELPRVNYTSRTMAPSELAPSVSEEALLDAVLTRLKLPKPIATQPEPDHIRQSRGPRHQVDSEYRTGRLPLGRHDLR